MNNDSQLNETTMIFLNAISDSKKTIKMGTFKRYIALYYLSLSFLNNEDYKQNITIENKNFDLTILGLRKILADLKSNEYIQIDEKNCISVTDKLTGFIKPFTKNEGLIKDKNEIITRFVNLLSNYNDEYILTVFFNEPTIKSTYSRNIENIESEKSRLAKLLTEFEKKIKDESIDKYDILAFWIKFILEKVDNNNE